jgi:hypothetical protein
MRKQVQTVLKYPHLTTTWPLNDRADVANTISKLEKKLFVYGILSDKERAYLDKFAKKNPLLTV